MSSEVTTQTCPYCAEEIKIEAVKCKHCGERLDRARSLARQEDASLALPPRSRFSAAILSFLVPGAGQVYKHQVAAGVVYFVAIVFAYFFLHPAVGFLFHVGCVINAATQKVGTGA